MGRGDLSDDQWAVLEPLLPAAVLGRPPLGRRRLIDGIRWRVRTGAPWRDLPSEYGPWQTVYGPFICLLTSPAEKRAGRQRSR
ncbi:transposase [Streptomyces sp. NPDC001594]|uniref:transposase n=1 Tax=Streptomyces sp. NPDC001594 TaxID=3364590 RepID=UPI00368D0B4D